MNLVNYGNGAILLPLGDTPIIIGNKIYTGLVSVFRLLNTVEIKRIDRIKLNSPIDEELMYDEIISTCMIDIIGHDSKDPIDIDALPAGIVSTIAKTIWSMSVSHTVDPIRYIEDYHSKVTSLDIVAAVVARYMNLKFEDALNTPINKLYEYYSICAKAFPSEVALPKEPETTEASKVGDNNEAV